MLSSTAAAGAKACESLTDQVAITTSRTRWAISRIPLSSQIACTATASGSPRQRKLDALRERINAVTQPAGPA
ncbi:hypothetical protein [Nocardia brasiliensis]